MYAMRRDCVNGVYGCSDMTECVPSFNFAPQRAFTIGDAARAAGAAVASSLTARDMTMVEAREGEQPANIGEWRRGAAGAAHAQRRAGYAPYWPEALLARTPVS